MQNDSSIKQDLTSALNDFYQQYIVETANGSFQVFRSFTYGEMVISFLLTCIVVLFVLKWIWEVVR